MTAMKSKRNGGADWTPANETECQDIVAHWAATLRREGPEHKEYRKTLRWIIRRKGLEWARATVLKNPR